MKYLTNNNFISPQYSNTIMSTESVEPANDRQDMLDAAIKFLKDPKVSDAPLAKRVAFLESKGLTSHEIQTALQLSQQQSTSIPAIPMRNAAQNAVTPAIQKTSWWKDATMSILAISAFGYGAVHLTNVI